MPIQYSISDQFLTIHESHKVRSVTGMKEVLERVRRENIGKDYPILRRTDRDIIDEWKVHNLFYNLHVFRLHTGTVDLEYPQRWWFRIGYRVLSKLVKG